MNLIAFSGPQNCVNTQYAVLSGAMLSIFGNHVTFDARDIHQQQTIFSDPGQNKTTFFKGSGAV